MASSHTRPFRCLSASPGNVCAPAMGHGPSFQRLSWSGSRRDAYPQASFLCFPGHRCSLSRDSGSGPSPRCLRGAGPAVCQLPLPPAGRASCSREALVPEHLLHAACAHLHAGAQPGAPTPGPSSRWLEDRVVCEQDATEARSEPSSGPPQRLPKTISQTNTPLSRPGDSALAPPAWRWVVLLTVKVFPSLARSKTCFSGLQGLLFLSQWPLYPYPLAPGGCGDSICFLQARGWGACGRYECGGCGSPRGFRPPNGSAMPPAPPPQPTVHSRRLQGCFLPIPPPNIARGPGHSQRKVLHVESIPRRFVVVPA